MYLPQQRVDSQHGIPAAHVMLQTLALPLSIFDAAATLSEDPEHRIAYCNRLKAWTVAVSLAASKLTGAAEHTWPPAAGTAPRQAPLPSQAELMAL
jgi:hypothetical protein